MSRKLPEMEVNNYTAIFTKPIFKNQNGEWYRDVGYTDSIDLIRENFQGAAKSFIAIGFYLKHLKEDELYKEGNYQNIWECAQAEFGLSQSVASRYMNMNDAFSIDGNTPLLDDKYNDFNKSQLQEMLALPEDKREEIKAIQTVNEIRNIAKQEKEVKEPSEKEIRFFYDSHVKEMDYESRETLKDRLKDKYRKAGGYDGIIDYSGSARGITINKADEITWSQLVKLIQQYIPKAPIDRKHTDNSLEGEQLPGQMCVEDYPEVLPDTYKVPSIHESFFTVSEIEDWKNSVTDKELRDRISVILDSCSIYHSDQILLKVSCDFKNEGKIYDIA